MYTLYKEELLKLQTLNRYRSLSSNFLNKSSLDFSTNDYLAFSKNPDIINAAIEAAKKFGVGATGSRLLSGNNFLIESLENQIAKDKHTESALVFNTGFQANISVLSALLDSKILQKPPLVFFDKANHASLYQAVFLSKATLIRYEHANIDQLSHLLEKFRVNTNPKFIVTETVFGMDGDILKINDIANLAHKYKAFLYLDEAHATGVFGLNGYGLSSLVDLRKIPHLIMGTFSKAIGCSGGYVACNEVLKNYLLNKATGFIYSTANSPMLVGAILQAWNMIKDFDSQRNALLKLSALAKEKIINLGFKVANSESNIISIILGQEAIAIEVKKKLLDRSILVSCIRPPTVPLGTSRIRIAFCVNHTQQDLYKLIDALQSI